MSIFEPPSEHNRTLKENVFPDDWNNPQPRGKYNLVVIGGGTAGLICAAGAAGLGARVALIEKTALGGDCLNVGCVPSKALVRAARAAHEARTGEARFGVRSEEVTVDFPAVMERMRKMRAAISPVDSATRYTRELGVDVFLGEGHFIAPDTAKVGGQALRFARAVIATGARAAHIPIPGLWESGALNNETIFSLTELPRRLAVIGAGPIGCELAQAFARFGSEVTLLDNVKPVLNREDPDASAVIEEALRRDGVTIKYEYEIAHVESGRPGKTLHLVKDGDSQRLVVDHILVGVGRAPNVENIGLEKAGVEYSHEGVVTDDHLRTTNKRIFAAGDISLRHKFTHTADASARIVLQNALFFGRRKISALTEPWCTYTDPEVGHVGIYPGEAEERGLAIRTFTQPLSHVDRAILDGEDAGFVKIHVRKGTPDILGATVVAAHAGDLLGELSLAVTNGVGLDKIAATIHPYPTQAEAIKRVADTYNRTRLTPFVAKILRLLLRWQRR
ncbi:MAG: mercuric reductase [Akkermansiaceae bacterium]|nr:mercuric reductase [Akkermansiaceae bacterium]